MIIIVIDNGFFKLMGMLMLEIDIIDVNDNDFIVRGMYIVIVFENVLLYYVVFSIDVFDVDGEVFGILRYEIVLFEMNLVFKIEENIGIL